MPDPAEIDRIQKQHYDSIAVQYALHYGDKWSQAYRRRFINGPMLGDVELEGRQVLDAMCGSGETTGYLLERGALVTGLDISQNEMRLFRERYPTCRAVTGSIFSSGLPDDSFDCVLVIGGLHHLHPDVPRAIAEIHRVLRPGGVFCFFEPHAGSLPDRVRQVWYRHDRSFAENEASLDLDTLRDEFTGRFEFVREEYGGNLAYLLVLNSMIWRISPAIKRIYSPLLLAAETWLRPLQRRGSSCFVIGRWRKNHRT